MTYLQILRAGAISSIQGRLIIRLPATLYKAARQQGRKLVTTNYVIGELVALMTSPLRVPRLKTIEFIDSIKASPYVEAIHVDATIDAEAWQLLSDRQDKEWSLVDCSSFVVMQQPR